MSSFDDPNVKKVVRSWSNGITQSLLITVCAFFLAMCIFRNINPVFVFSLETISLILGAGTVLGVSGMVTWSGTTPAERLDKSLLKWLTRSALFFSSLTISIWYFTSQL